MLDVPTQTILDQVEKDLLAEIVQNLEQSRITPEQAERLAKEFLALLPVQDKHDLLIKLGKFSKLSAAGKSLYLKYAAPIEDEERQQKLTLMSEHIKNGQIDHALSVAKGATNGG
jgi:hypothetical protein